MDLRHECSHDYESVRKNNSLSQLPALVQVPILSMIQSTLVMRNPRVLIAVVLTLLMMIVPLNQGTRRSRNENYMYANAKSTRIFNVSYNEGETRGRTG